MRATSANAQRDYLDLARDYERAASALATAGGALRAPAAFRHLTAHGFELTFKAALARTESAKALIGIGHDLSWCLRLAERRGLRIPLRDAGIRTAVDQLSSDHLAQSYRYPTQLRWAPALECPDMCQALRAAIAAVEERIRLPLSFDRLSVENKTSF